MSNKPPIEVPQGAIRLNTDSQKLEFFAQDRWYEMATDVPTLNGSVRGFASGGYPNSSVIDFFNIDTQGNAADFGDRTISGQDPGSASSRTRGLMAAGHTGANQNIIDFITMSSKGDAQDFGDMTFASHGVSRNLGNETRGILGGGVNTGFNNIIDFVTIASTGDAIDFGDISNAARNVVGGSSPTRSVFYIGKPGNSSASDSNIMDFITIATTGNAQDFGDLTFTGRYGAGGSNSIRCIMLNGGGGGSGAGQIDFVNIATLGNATTFGELSRGETSVQLPFCATSPTRIVIGNGQNPQVNTMEYAQIMTQGTFVDFGDATISNSARCGFSNGHGGL